MGQTVGEGKLHCVYVCVVRFGVPYYVRCVSMYVCICTYVHIHVHIRTCNINSTVYHCNSVTYCGLYRSS